MHDILLHYLTVFQHKLIGFSDNEFQLIVVAAYDQCLTA